MTTETPKKNGRPQICWHERAQEAHNYALLGAKDVEIAQFLGISLSALKLAKKKHQSFGDAIKRGRILADAEVAARLYLRCTGYESTEVTTREIRSESGELLSIETVTVTRAMPPDVDACIFWLTNRQPDKWRNKFEVDHTDMREPGKTDSDGNSQQDEAQ